MGASQTKQEQQSEDSGLIPLYHDARDDARYSNEERACVRIVEELSASQMTKLAALGTRVAFIKGDDDTFVNVLAYYYPTDMISELTSNSSEIIIKCHEIIKIIQNLGIVVDPLTVTCAFNYIIVNNSDINQVYAIVNNMLIANQITSIDKNVMNTIVQKMFEFANDVTPSRSMNRMVTMGGDPYDTLMSRGRTGGANEEEGANLELPTNMYLARIAERREQVIGELLGMFDKLDYAWINETSALEPGQRLRKITEYLRVHTPTNAEGLINRIIESINSTYGITVIEPSAPMRRKLSDTTDFMNALSHGMCVDFFALGIDMKRYMNNLSILNEALKRWNETASKMYPKLQEAHIQNSFNKLINDQKRAINLIRTALNEKYAPTLLGLMNPKENPNLATSDRAIALNALTKMHSVADAALFLVQIIRELGLEFDKIKSLKSKSELLNVLVGADETGEILSEPGTQKLLEFALGAMSRDYNEIVQEMDRVIKRDDRERGENVREGSRMSRRTGGADPSQLVINALEMRRKKSDLFLNTYGRVMEGGIDKIRETIDALSHEIGDSVPTGQLLDNFIILLRQLADVKLETNSVHRALLGYHKDAGAQEERTRVIGTLEEIAKYAEMVASNSEYTSCADSFLSISRAIRDFISGVDQSRDNFKRIVGAKGDEAQLTSRTGGDPLDDMISGMKNIVVRSRLRLQDAISRAEYKSRVVTIKANLKLMQTNFAKDVATYDTSVLGPAVARRIDDITKASIEFEKVTKTNGFATLGNVVDNNMSEEGKKFMRSYVSKIRDFWESAQSVELYLKYFTRDLIKNATDIDDIMQMIREVRLVTQMYHNTIGNDLRNALTEDIPAGTSQFTITRMMRSNNIISQNNLSQVSTGVESGIKQYNALKNLISFFVHFGSKIGGAELRKMIPRTPQTIYKGLINFLIASTYYVGSKITDSIDSLNLGGIRRVPLPNKADLNVYLHNPRSMSDTSANYDTTIAPLSLDIERELFTAIIKSFGAKILVLSGMHDLINRPHEPIRRQNLVRSIIGAGEESFPKIEPDVVELYLRLVLLARYYQEEFVEPSTIAVRYSGEDGAHIVLIPELSGSDFSSFINLMFTKMTRREVKYFTDGEIKAIIIEINKIWSSLSPKFQKDKIRSIAREFVRVISNMLYIVRARDGPKYAELRKRKLSEYANEAEQFDVDILGDEGYDDDQIFRPPLPDAQYRSSAGSTDALGNQRDLLHVDTHWDLVRKFRSRLDKLLQRDTNISLRGSIIATQSKITQTSSDADRFSLVCGMLRGTGAMTTIDEMRRMIFVEVMGTSLGLIHEMSYIMRYLRNIAFIMNPDNLKKCLKTIRDDNSYVVTANNHDSLITNMCRYITSTFGDNIGDNFVDNISNIINVIFNGYYVNTANTIVRGNDSTYLYSIVGGNNPTDNQIDGMAVHFANRFNGMQTFLNYVIRTVNQTHELVHVNITDGRLYVDFGSFSEYIRKYFANLAEFVNAMRPHIDKEMIEKYTKKENVGSLYYLYDIMITSFVEGDQNEDRRNASFMRVTENITKAYSALIARVEVQYDGAPNPAPYYVDYSTVMARVIAHGDGEEIKDVVFKYADVISDGFDALLVGGNIDTHLKDRVVDTRFLHSLDITNNDTSIFMHSMFLSFNKQIQQFLRAMYDPAAGKIYSGLVTPLRDTFTDAIHLERDTYPDHLPFYWIESGKLHDTATISHDMNMVSIGESNRANEAPFPRYIDDMMTIFDDTSDVGLINNSIMPFYDDNSYNIGVHKFVIGLTMMMRMDNLATDDDYNLLFESILNAAIGKTYNITINSNSRLFQIEPAKDYVIAGVDVYSLFINPPYNQESGITYKQYMRKVISQTIIKLMRSTVVTDDYFRLTKYTSGMRITDDGLILIGNTLNLLLDDNQNVQFMSHTYVSMLSSENIIKIIDAMNNYLRIYISDYNVDQQLFMQTFGNEQIIIDQYNIGGYNVSQDAITHITFISQYGNMIYDKIMYYVVFIYLMSFYNKAKAGFPARPDLNINTMNNAHMKKYIKTLIKYTIIFIEKIHLAQHNSTYYNGRYVNDTNVLNNIISNRFVSKSWCGFVKPISDTTDASKYTVKSLQYLMVNPNVNITNYFNSRINDVNQIITNIANNLRDIQILLQPGDPHAALISILHYISNRVNITINDVSQYKHKKVKPINPYINKLYPSNNVIGDFSDALTLAAITIAQPTADAKRVMNIRNGIKEIAGINDVTFIANVRRNINNRDAYNQLFDNFTRQIPTSITSSKGYVTNNDSRVRHIISLDELNNAKVMGYTDRLPDYSGTFIVFAGDSNLDPYTNNVLDYHKQVHLLAAAPNSNNFMPTDAFNTRQIPDGKHILFATTAHRLHNIFYTRDNIQSATHVIASAAEVPTHMREKIRAHAPYYRAMFLAIVNKCEFMRQLIENTVIGKKMEINADDQCVDQITIEKLQNAIIAAAPTFNNYEAIGYNFGNDNIKIRVLDMLRSMTNGSQAIVKACDDTIAAIGDTPHYFEIARDSIATYRAQNNTDPIMPITPLINAGSNINNNNMFIPQSGINTTEFKYQYAVRGLYCRKIENDEKAGDMLTALDSMINTFNKYAHGHIKIDNSLSHSLARSIIMGFDYVTNSDQFQLTIAGVNNAHAYSTNMHINSSDFRQIGIDIPASVAVVESLTRNDAIHKVLSSATGDERQVSADMLYANIIDLNIVPFDVHVLARQLPLHFILNYAYTFDTIIADMMSLPGDRVTIDDNDDTKPVDDGRRAFMSMIARPMANYTPNECEWIYRVMSGGVNLPYFGQPKFLNDQMLAKVLTIESSIGSDLPSKGTYYQVNLGDSYIYAPSVPTNAGAALDLNVNTNINNVTRNDLNTFNNVVYNYSKLNDNYVITFVNSVLKVISNSINIQDNKQTIYDLIMAVASISEYVRDNNIPADVSQKMIDAGPGATRQLSYCHKYDENNIIWRTANNMFKDLKREIVLMFTVPFNYRNTAQIIFNYADIVSPLSALAQRKLNSASNNIPPVINVPGKNPFTINNLDISVNPLNSTVDRKNTQLGPLFDMSIIRNLIHIHLVFETVQMRLNSDMTYMRPDINEQSVVTDRSALSQSMYHFYGPEYKRNAPANATSPDRTI